MSGLLADILKGPRFWLDLAPIWGMELASRHPGSESHGRVARHRIEIASIWVQMPSDPQNAEDL
jgi:hypothetical protein